MQGSPYATEIISNPKAIKEDIMKHRLKITTIWSLLIITCLVIGACGGGTEQLARNQGDIAITVTDSTGAPLSGVQVQVRTTAGTGAFDNVGTTDAAGHLTFTGEAGKDYFFTLSKAGFATQTDILRTPQLTSTVALNVTMSVSTGGTISGTAVKGPVANATMTAFSINNGAMGSQIGTGQTDAQGNFTMSVGDYSGPVMLQMKGGSYVDEATGNTMTMQQSDMMTSVIPSMSAGATLSGVQMTPLTSMAQTMAQGMSGGMTAANIATANTAMGNYFMVNDILHVHPMDPLTPGAGNSADQNMKNYGMAIAAMTQLAKNAGMPFSSGMVTAMMNDASDGHMNGMMGTSPIQMGGGMMGGTMMPSNSGTSGMATAMSQFIQSSMNKSGVTLTDMQSLMNKLTASNGVVQ
jgi:hypothetical protein